MTVRLVWAQSTSGVIGRDNAIPWRVPEDMARFKELTMGHPVLMGRLTWESLPAKFRPLPGRHNIVLSRDPDYPAEGAEVVTAVPADFDGWIIGGAQIYAATLALAERCEVTEIDVDLRRDDHDAVAPLLDESWTGTEGEWLTSSSGLRYRFTSYVRT